ncbi:MAG: RhuM family protein, partial [Pseudonocardiaceae bacterium]
CGARPGRAMSEPGGEVIVYRSPDGKSLVQLRAVAGTAWLAQAQIAELYDTSVSNVAHIVRRILDDGEVSQATIDSESRVQAEGARTVRREVKVYNLDMVLAVGYRVSSPRAVQFRQWATTVLREYLVKGFVLDDPRLKDPAGSDYFDELLQRIRDIRASEKRFYQKVRDLFAATSADYDGTSDTAKNFFATIQNKLIFAVTGSTAAELVMRRSDARSPSMGLTTWTGDRIRKSDVVIAKNYLTMLAGSGSVSASGMKAVAAERYAEFDERRKAAEAERAEADELEDLRTLTAIENRRADPERDEDGHLP